MYEEEPIKTKIPIDLGDLKYKITKAMLFFSCFGETKQIRNPKFNSIRYVKINQEYTLIWEDTK